MGEWSAIRNNLSLAANQRHSPTSNHFILEKTVLLYAIHPPQAMTQYQCQQTKITQAQRWQKKTFGVQWTKTNGWKKEKTDLDSTHTTLQVQLKWLDRVGSVQEDCTGIGFNFSCPPPSHSHTLEQESRHPRVCHCYCMCRSNDKLKFTGKCTSRSRIIVGFLALHERAAPPETND